MRRLLEVASRRRNGPRWAIAFALGLRQGEVLGLKWSDVDLDDGRLIVRRARLRPRWQHGCDGKCGQKVGGNCPQRVSVRPVAADTKSRAGLRAIGLPDELVALLHQHRELQAVERVTAGELWQDGGWVFASVTGAPVNPNADYDEWKRLLRRAGLRDGRLHDARHTAATVLLILGVPERAVMDIIGWSSSLMARRYQHITAEIRADIARRVGAFIWDDRDEDHRPGGTRASRLK